ncbi:MAG TPA: transcriptional regulator [Terracidiphilus sp.]|jgi:DNA-binding transcriptional ArsR family regulator|nr:transcriptional regulator [Terracidiphilus sp.]
MPETGFPEVNRIIHEPARLAILTVLSACLSADFNFLQSATGLTKGNLSVQLTRLEEAGLIYIDKTLHSRKMRTTAELSNAGRIELKEYWRTMKKIQQQSASQVG